MSPAPFEYRKPEDWEEAAALLDQPAQRVLPFFIPPKPRALQDLGVDVLVDLSQLGLDRIEKYADGRVHIGALTTLQQIAESPSLMKDTHGLLASAALLAASFGVRNLASLGGAVLARGGPPEIPLALLALEAQVVIQGAGGLRWELPFEEFCESGGAALNPQEILVGVRFAPLPATGCGVALERIARTPHDEAILAAATVVQASGGKISRASLGLSGASPLLIDIPETGELLIGQALTRSKLDQLTHLIDAQMDPIDDYRGSLAYRRAMAGVLARRALETAWKMANKNPGS